MRLEELLEGVGGLRVPLQEGLVHLGGLLLGALERVEGLPRGGEQLGERVAVNLGHRGLLGSGWRLGRCCRGDMRLRDRGRGTGDRGRRNGWALAVLGTLRCGRRRLRQEVLQGLAGHGRVLGRREAHIGARDPDGGLGAGLRWNHREALGEQRGEGDGQPGSGQRDERTLEHHVAIGVSVVE